MLSQDKTIIYGCIIGLNTVKWQMRNIKNHCTGCSKLSFRHDYGFKPFCEVFGVWNPYKKSIYGGCDSYLNEVCKKFREEEINMYKKGKL